MVFLGGLVTTALTSVLLLRQLQFTLVIEHLNDLLGAGEGAIERDEDLLLGLLLGSTCLYHLALQFLVLALKDLNGFKKLSLLLCAES